MSDLSEVEAVALEFITNPSQQVAVDHSRRRCVDGGYRPGQSDGSLACAGADLGTSMALLAMENPSTGEKFTPQEAFEVVYEALQDNNLGDYCWHSDTHEGHDGVVVGCGHCNAAITEASKKYGLSGEIVRGLLDVIRQAHDDDNYQTEFIELDRDHAELGILVNAGSNRTVKPWNMETGEQYFVYDQALHIEYLQKITKSIGLDFEQLKAAIDAQTTATLGALASSQGKPMIEFNLDDPDQVEVKLVGHAPSA